MIKNCAGVYVRPLVTKDTKSPYLLVVDEFLIHIFRCHILSLVGNDALKGKQLLEQRESA